MKLKLILLFSVLLPQLSLAFECEHRESAPLIYECTNAQNVLCVTKAGQDSEFYSVLIGRHNGGADGLSMLKAKETNKSFTIFKRERTLLFTTMYVNFKLNKRTNVASFRGFTRNLLEIGDGPHWTFDAEQQDFTCARVTP